MDKKLALLLVLALLISIMPITALAASENSISKIPHVKENYKFINPSDAPQLSIEEKSVGELRGETQVFRLKLENAEWLKDSDLAGSFQKNMASLSDGLTVTIITDTTVQVEVYDTDDSRDSKKMYKIPILAEVTGKGEARVVIDPRESTVSRGTYVFAIAVGGDTTITVHSVEKFANAGKIGDIEIEEKRAGALPKDKEKKITLKLPTDFKWVSSGSLFGTGGLKGITAKADIDGRTLDFIVDYSQASNRSQIGSLVIKGAEIEATKDAKPGYVSLKISGDGIPRGDGRIAEHSDKDIDIPEPDKGIIFTIGSSKYIVDKTEVKMDTAPYIKDGRTMLPIRFVAEALGVEQDNIVWNPEARTVTILKEGKTVSITIGSKELKVNGTTIQMDTVAEIKDGRTMLPISFIGKALDAQVDWNPETKTVTIK